MKGRGLCIFIIRLETMLTGRVIRMDNMETMEVCECGNITYMVKEHYSPKGENLQSLLEKIIIRQASNHMSK